MIKPNDLEEFIHVNRLQKKDLATYLGVSSSMITQYLSGQRPIPAKKEELILKHPTWNKAPLLSSSIVAEPLSEYNSDVQEGDVIVSVPFVDKMLATSPDLNVRDLVREKGHTLEEFPFYKMVKGVDYIQTVITMAMAPRFLPGDYLFIRFRNGQVLSGKIYLVDTRIYGTMLRYVYIEDGGYTLKALNPEFKDVFVKNEDVYSISSAMLSVNTNTSLTSEVNLAELVKNRDKQIATLSASHQDLLQAQAQVLRSQQELIQEMRKQGERLDKERERTERERERTDKLIEKIINQ